MLADEIRKGHERGWSFTPLSGKKPIQKGWQRAERASLAESLEYATRGNVGMRTGFASMIIVVDDDTAGDHDLNLPATWTVETGGRTPDGRPRLQHYYRARGFVKNSAGTLAKGVDVRGAGGQVVFVGSRHEDTGELYRWAEGASPEDLPLADFPVEIFELERDRQLYQVAEMAQSGMSHRDIEQHTGLAKTTISRAVLPNVGPVQTSASKSGPVQRIGLQNGGPVQDPSLQSGPVHDSGPLFGPRSNGSGTQNPEWSKLPSQTQLAKQQPSQRLTRYAESALRLEVDRVAAAGEGKRNDTLNQAAFNLGRHVAAGSLDRLRVVNTLAGAARQAGLEDGEIFKTIDSGLEGGRRDPCYAPPGGWTQHAADEIARTVLAPGAHVDDNGEYHEIGSFKFAQTALRLLGPEAIYRKAGVAGTLQGDPGRLELVPMDGNDGRLLIDQRLRVGVWSPPKKDGEDASLKFRPCTKDWGSLLVSHASAAPGVRDIDAVVSYPVFLPGWKLAPEGYADRVFYDPPEAIRHLSPIQDIDQIRGTLTNLVVDFPFASPSDRANFFGLMLTPIIRPALEGNTPFHLVLSSLERTGKTKLVEQVFGHTILGDVLPSTPLAEQEEERQKAIVSLLLAGDTLIALDNLSGSIDSPSLASLLTSRVFAGRMLGQSRILKLANTITLVGTANNPTLTGELAKRTIPIQLQPESANPEDRTNFTHPDLLGYLKSVRRTVLSCLVGMVLNWIEAGRRPGRRLGGFEPWSEAVGGILAYHGWSDWRAKDGDWKTNTDPHAEDLERFIGMWHAFNYGKALTAAEALKLADSEYLFGEKLTAPSYRGRVTAMGMSILRRHLNTPVAGFIIRKAGSSARSEYCLEAVRD